MKSVSAVIADFCVIKQVLIATLIQSGYNVEAGDIEICEGCEGTWVVDVRFVIRR